MSFSKWMLMKRIFVSLVLLGCALFFVGLYVGTIRILDVGVCPVDLHAPPGYVCRNGGIYMTPIGNAVAFVGGVILVLSLAMFLRQHSSWWHKHGI
jgi:hypothetical protein